VSEQLKGEFKGTLYELESTLDALIFTLKERELLGNKGELLVGAWQNLLVAQLARGPNSSKLINCLLMSIIVPF
jgi:hypothetical protein